MSNSVQALSSRPGRQPGVRSTCSPADPRNASINCVQNAGASAPSYQRTKSPNCSPAEPRPCMCSGFIAPVSHRRFECRKNGFEVFAVFMPASYGSRVHRLHDLRIAGRGDVTLAPGMFAEVVQRRDVGKFQELAEAAHLAVEVADRAFVIPFEDLRL